MDILSESKLKNLHSCFPSTFSGGKAVSHLDRNVLVGSQVNVVSALTNPFIQKISFDFFIACPKIRQFLVQTNFYFSALAFYNANTLHHACFILHAINWR